MYFVKLVVLKKGNILTIKCEGCGIIKQIKDEQKIGFCKNVEQKLCQRCYQIKNYNKLPTTKLENEEFDKLLLEVGKTNKLILWILDTADLEGSYIKNIEKYLKKNKVILVGNKVDLLPKSLSEKKIKNWLIQSIDDDINIIDVILTSTKTKYNIDKLLELIDEFTTKDVYMIGATNTGKSSLINAIKKSVYSKYKNNVTTSFFAGTTLSTIEIVIDDYITLIDTPGIINEFQVINYLTTESLKQVIPNSELKPHSFQLNNKQTLFIAGLFRIDFLEGEKSTFTIYVSKNINIHRTKLEKADIFYEKHITTMPLVPPRKEELESLKLREKTNYELNQGKHSFTLAGLGWFVIDANSDIKIEIHYPKNILVKKRINLN